MTNAPAALTVVAGAVERLLQQLLAEEQERWVSVDPALDAPFKVLASYALSGGKRLRPAFCYWSYLGAGGDAENPVVIDAAAGLEMLHAAALIHDDIVDRSERRHGSPTAHLQLGCHHRDQGWSGASEQFGEGAALVVGDLALAYSNRLLAGAPRAAVDVFQRMQLEVNLGQFLDMTGAALGPGSPSDEDRARRIRIYKTAKYTIEGPMHLGVALADPDGFAAVQAAVSEFALPLGEAFQLTDDLLGVFGDPAITGKPVGDDLRQGKLTLLAVLAARGGLDLGADSVADVVHQMEANGVRSEVETLIAALNEEADNARRRLPFTDSAVAALGELADFLGARNR